MCRCSAQLNTQEQRRALPLHSTPKSKHPGCSGPVPAHRHLGAVCQSGRAQMKRVCYVHHTLRLPHELQLALAECQGLIAQRRGAALLTQLQEWGERGAGLKASQANIQAGSPKRREQVAFHQVQTRPTKWAALPTKATARPSASVSGEAGYNTGRPARACARRGTAGQQRRSLPGVAGG